MSMVRVSSLPRLTTTSLPCASSRAFGGLKRATTLIAELLRLLGRLFFIVARNEGTKGKEPHCRAGGINRGHCGCLACGGSTRSGSVQCRVQNTARELCLPPLPHSRPRTCRRRTINRFRDNERRCRRFRLSRTPVMM